MLIVGIPKEIKVNEYRVSMIPTDIKYLIDLNIQVYVQSTAGNGANFIDDDYINAGAIICANINEIYEKANLIIKVKEPQPEEYELINDKHTIFTFFHFASSSHLLKTMIEKKTTCLAYETLTNNNSFPILAQMSKIAGEQAMIEANKFRNLIIINDNNNDNNNKNQDDEITIIGVGNVGKAAVYKAIELNYKKINLIDKDYEKLKELKKENEDLMIYEMNHLNLSKLLMKSNIIIGSIYNNGEKAQKLIINDLLVIMPKDSVFMDVAIDQGGMTEKSKPTTVNDPYIKYHNTHIYCVPNIPSLVPHEASIKLSNVICPYVRTLAQEKTNDELESAINLKKGEIIHSSLRLLLLPLMLHI